MFSYLTSPITKTRSSLRRLTVGALAVGLLSGSVVLLPAVAEAAGTTLQVTTTADVAANAGACGDSGITIAPSPLSLREATCLAENIGGPVTINVGFGTYNLVNGELKVGTQPGNNTTINGASITGTVIDGGGLSRVLDVDPNSVGGVTTSVAGLTIRGGADDTYGGAGILAGSGNAATADTMTLNYVIVTDNHANVVTPATTNSPGGGMQFYGGSLTVNNATFSNNSSGNSPGSGLEYFSVPGLSGQQLTVSGSTFSGNTAAAGAAGVANGGALALQGSNGAYTVTNTRFTGNSVAGSGTGTPVGAGIWSENGAMTLTGSTFTGNSVSGGSTPSGGAVQMTSGSMTAHYNRFTGNTAATGSAIAANVPVTATDNWWGCNTGPGTSGCDTTAGTVTSSPRLAMTASASPATVVGPNATATITADLTKDSVGATVAGSQLSAFDNLPVTWSDPAGDATVAGTSSTLASGLATTSFNSHTTVGPENVNATLDNATAIASLAVNQAPSVTSPNSAAFSVGSAGSFTVTTAGYPAPALSETGTLPTGLTFTDNGNGTATIAGTPTGSGGSFPLNLTANNGVSPNATQTLTLSVGQPPAFTSPSTATFRRGTAGSFTVTTSGVPTVATVTETGSLPSGVTFTDNGNGTATIAGTPTSSGTFPVSLTAANGVSPNATQSLTVQVNQAPAVTTNPTDQTVQPSTSVTFTAAASGVPTPTVQWQRSTDGGASFSNIAGATSTSYTFTASAGDDGNQYRAVFTNVAGSATSTAATLSVGTAPAFTSTDHADFIVGQAGSFTINTTGIPSATLSRTGAQFPAWLTLTDNGDGTGSLTGTPPAGSAGNYSFTLKAANGFSPSASQSFTLHVNQPPAITSASSAVFRRGEAGTFTVTTSGAPSATLTESGSLPSGVTFTDNGDGTATIAGTPTAGGSYAITVTAANGVQPDATQAFTLTVNQPPVITSTDHATFTTERAGNFTVTTTPGQPAATTLTETGSLPSGVTFTDNGNGTATLAGTPAGGTGGSYPITITGSNGVQPNATQAFTLTVNQPPAITSNDSAIFLAGIAGDFTVTTTPGNPTAIVITETGTLPAGLTFTDNGDGTATVAGTPTAGGSYPITLTASNGVQPDATQTVTLTVEQPPAITSADHATFTAGTAGSFTVTTTPGQPTSTTLTETGALPSGVTFTDNGDGTASLAGTPAVGSGGAHPVTVTASNGTAPDAVQSFTLTTNEAPAVTAQPADATAASGQSVTFSAAATGFPAPTVQWQKSTDNGGTFTDVPGANGTDLTFSADLTDSSARFRAVFTNSTDHVETTAGVLTVGTAPAITSGSTAAATVGSAGSFTVTATGTPTPEITHTGALPAGVTFTDNGDGTATLAGTPATGSAGTYPIGLTAGNGVGSAATQTLTLTVSPPAVAVPGAPTIGSATPGDGSATVSFTPPGSTGGAPITGYTVTSSPGGKTATGTGSPITVGGLTDGTRYTFTVRATNSAGTGTASAASNAVTPAISMITVKYLQLGGLRSLLGAPIGPEYALAGGAGRDFQQGRIYYSPATGAHEVHGAILQRFLVLGGPTGLLGYPTTDERQTATGSGRYNHFAGADGASIFWSPATGAWSIHGAIRNKWISMGAERGLLGYPTTDETGTASGTGRYNHFAGADGASIFWSPATGAWSIHGAIRNKWISLGAERGQLGYPVSDESAITGGRRNTFVHGWLLWRPDGQLTVVNR